MYITLEKAKEYLGTTDLTDAQIEFMIGNASTFMNTHVGYQLGYKPTDDARDLMFSGDDWNFVGFGNHWCIDFDSVEVDGVDISDSVIKMPMNSNFVHGIMRKGSNFPNGIGNITVKGAKIGAYTVSFGQDEHTLPDELTHACGLILKSMVKRADPDNEDVQGAISSERTSQYTIQYGTKKDLTDDETNAMNIIGKYVQFAIA